jgi:hypothetical protein
MTEIEDKRKELEEHIRRIENNKDYDNDCYHLWLTKGRDYQLELNAFNLGVELARKEFLDEIITGILDILKELKQSLNQGEKTE